MSSAFIKIFALLCFFHLFRNTNSLLRKSEAHISKSITCSNPQFILSRATNYYLGSAGSYHHYATMNYNYEKWCILPTGHILNILNNEYMYVYYGDIYYQTIMLYYFNLESYDGGNNAKWSITQASEGYVNIRSLANIEYGVSLTKDHSSVELRKIVKGDIDQEWIIHPG